MTRPIPFRQFIANLPVSLWISWLALGLGFLLLAIGYSLRLSPFTLAGAALFITSLAIAYGDYRWRRHARDRAAPYLVGMSVGLAAAGYFHLFMLLIGLAGAGIMAWISDFDRVLALRLLHFWVVSFSFATFLMVTKVARRTPAGGPPPSRR